MKSVIKLCSEFLISELTLKNCVEILNMGDMFSIYAVRSKALQYVLHHFDRVFGYAGLAVNISRTSTPSSCSSVPRVIKPESRSDMIAMDTTESTDIDESSEKSVKLRAKIEAQTSSSSLGISLTCMIDREQLSKLQVEHFCILLQSDLLCVYSELALFHIVAAWIDVDKDCHMKYASDVMQHVRFALMSPEELVDQVIFFYKKILSYDYRPNNYT